MRDATQLALTALAMSLAACLSPLSAAAQEMASAPAESANVTATQVADGVSVILVLATVRRWAENPK